MSSAREDLQKILADRDVPEVDFPMTFDDISLISASSSDNTAADGFIDVPAEAEYTVSGDNLGGFIVTAVK